VKSIIFSFFLSMSLYGAVADFINSSCQYKIDNIFYKNIEIKDGVISVQLNLKSTNSNGFCQDINLGRNFKLTKKLSNQETNFLSFIFNEYLSYSIPITSSSKIVKELLDFKRLKIIQQKKRREIENLISSLGLSLKEVKNFRDEVLIQLSPIDIYCLDNFVMFYRDEVDKLKILKEYASLLYQYKLNTSTSNMIFEKIIKKRIGYTDSLKKIFIISLADHM